MRISSEFSERAYAGAVSLAGGDGRMAFRAFAPHDDGSLVTLEEAFARIVAWRLHAHNPKVGIGVFPRPRSSRRPRWLQRRNG